MTVSGTITVSITATDAVGVTRVDLYIDSVYAQTTNSFPYSFALDTTTLTNGEHDLVAKAYDAADNEGTSSEFTIDVLNEAGETNLQHTSQLRGTNIAGGEMAWGSYNLGTTQYDTGVALRGINRAGGEYGCDWEGWNGQTFYTIPSNATLQTELDYLKAKGFNYIRFPIAWERIQHSLNGDLNTIYLDKVIDFVDTCNGAGFRVMIDLHCYGRYATGTHTSTQGTTQTAGYTQRQIGDGTLTWSHLSDVWTKIATVFASYPANMVDYDLMNEPHDLAMTSTTFFAGVNTVIAAIRAVDTTHLLIVPNTRGSDMDHWSVYSPGDLVLGGGNGGPKDDVAALAVTDSSSNFCFGMHGYENTTSTQWTTAATTVTNWAVTNSRRLLLSEFGINNAIGGGDSEPTESVSYTPNVVFTLTSQTGVTNYLYVPTAYDDTHATPFALYVWLHGCGGYAQYDVLTDHYTLGSSQQYITLAVGGRENACWSSYATDGSKILNAIAYVKARFNIDPQRVIIGGYSSGGDIGYELMFKNADLFAGGIFQNTQPSSAAMTAAATATSKPTIIQLSALSDTTYPIATVRTRLASLTSLGYSATGVEVSGTHYDGNTLTNARTYALPYIASGGWLAPSDSGEEILGDFLDYLDTNAAVWMGWTPWNLQSGANNYNVTLPSNYLADGPSMPWYENNLTANTSGNAQLYTSGTAYLFPSNADIDYLASIDMNFVRLIFTWEVLQETLTGSITTGAYATRFWELLAYITNTKGMYCMVEPHGGSSANFAAFKGTKVGTGAVTSAAFADFWSKLAADTRMKDNPKTIIGLSNEPNFHSGSDWWDAAQEATDAIRDAGFTNLVMVPGFGFTHSSTWTGTAPLYGGDQDTPERNNAYYALSFTDKLSTIDEDNYPTGNFCFSTHQYFDTDGGGASTGIVNSAIGVTRAQNILDWCVANNKRCHISEFAAKASTSGAATAVSNLLAYLDANPTNCLGWAWWGYGPPTWWGSYQFTLCPTSSYTVDSPQLALISGFLP